MIEIVFEILFELFVEFLAQLLFEIGFESVASALRSKRKANPVLSIIGLIILGLIIGIIFSLIAPKRIFSNYPVTGLSLIISPLCVGTVMYYFGNWRRKKGTQTTIIATFWGGAIFAFVVALTRLIITNWSMFY